jgi:16S rRNA (guanine(527)-N(7))-methyltransferase RsmG
MSDSLITPAHAETLAAGIAQLQLTVSATQQQQLLQYLATLHKWNKAFNLSGLTKLDEMLSLHILDSLTVLPFIKGSRVADIGTGAGLPGMVLAICLPETQFFLVDSNSKKTRFIFQAAHSLGLQNVQAVHARAEDYAIAPQVAIVLSRAFASIKHFVESSQHLLAADGALLAMKGQFPAAELSELPADFIVSASHSLTVPSSAVTRHLLEIRRQNNSKVQNDTQ